MDVAAGEILISQTIATEIGVSLPYGVPARYSIRNEECTRARVTIGVPALFNTCQETGDQNAASVLVGIYCIDSGGNRTIVSDREICGRSTTLYERSVTFPLSGRVPWVIEVCRLTPDSDRPDLVNATYWSAVEEIIDRKPPCPNSVYTTVEHGRFAGHFDGRENGDPNDIPSKVVVIAFSEVKKAVERRPGSKFAFSLPKHVSGLPADVFIDISDRPLEDRVRLIPGINQQFYHDFPARDFFRDRSRPDQPLS